MPEGEWTKRTSDPTHPSNPKRRPNPNSKDDQPRRYIIGVMGDGDADHEPLSGEVGAIIAEGGYHLLTGGGAGVMEAVSRAYSRANPQGLVIGIIRADKGAHLVPQGGVRTYRPSAVNPYVEVPIFTHLPDSTLNSRIQCSAPGCNVIPCDEHRNLRSRNHINVLTADAVVVLPGGSGTLTELQFAYEYQWSPIFLCLGPGSVAEYSAAQLAAKFPKARLCQVGQLAAQLQAALP